MRFIEKATGREWSEEATHAVWGVEVTNTETSLDYRSWRERWFEPVKEEEGLPVIRIPHARGGEPPFDGLAPKLVARGIAACDAAPSDDAALIEVSPVVHFKGTPTLCGLPGDPVKVDWQGDSCRLAKVTESWSHVTCPECLKQKPAAASVAPSSYCTRGGYGQ